VKPPTMTREFARAASMDAANARMRKAGRVAWSRADFNEAVRVFNRLWPIENDVVPPSRPRQPGDAARPRGLRVA
jgi:hypothetical protein